MAERANLTYKQLSAMLCGRKIIFADIVPQLASALNVSVNELYAPISKDENASKLNEAQFEENKM